MKKIFLLFLSIFTLLVSSCSSGNKQDLESLRKDEVSSSIRTELNINFDEKSGSICLNPHEEEAKSYYSIYVSENASESLFTYRMSFDEYINKHLKSVPVNCLTFADSLYVDEINSFISTLYDKENGISKLSLGLAINEEAKWTKSPSIDYLLDVKDSGKTNVELVVVYLPTYFVRVYNSNEILKAYVFVPVYMTFEVDGFEISAPTSDNEKYSLKNSSVSGIKEVELKFKEDTEDNPNNHLYLLNK
ncbi:MAG: hypothetical protein ACI35S_03530 [Anaeroplasma sp.]